MHFNAYREGLKDFLAMTASNPPHTNKQIFETFLYGHYAHRDQKWEAIYQEWEKNRAEFVPLQAIFLLVVSTMFGHARELRQVVQQLLAVDDERLEHMQE